MPLDQHLLEQEHVTKTELTSRMKTSRASLDLPSIEQIKAELGGSGEEDR